MLPCSTDVSNILQHQSNEIPVLYCLVERSTVVVEHLFGSSTSAVERLTAQSNNEFGLFVNFKYIKVGKLLEL